MIIEGCLDVLTPFFRSNRMGKHTRGSQGKSSIPLPGLSALKRIIPMRHLHPILQDLGGDEDQEILLYKGLLFVLKEPAE